MPVRHYSLSASLPCKTEKKSSKQRPGASRFVLTPFPISCAVDPHCIPKERNPTPLLRVQRSKSSEWIVTEMPALKLGILSLSFRSTSAKEIITRSSTRRVITITVPAPPSSLTTTSSLHTDEVHLILLIGEVVKSRHSQWADECFHSYRPNGVEEVVHYGSRTIARV